MMCVFRGCSHCVCVCVYKETQREKGLGDIKERFYIIRQIVAITGAYRRALNSAHALPHYEVKYSKLSLMV